MSAELVSTAFCIDCGRDRHTCRDVIAFTPDSGWVADFMAPVAEGAPLHGITERRGPDGSRWVCWQAQVIGWAVVENHYRDQGHEHEIEPVLLEEDMYPVLLQTYREDRDKHLKCRITRTPDAAR